MTRSEQLLEFIKTHPGSTMDDILLEFPREHYTRNLVTTLVKNGHLVRGAHYKYYISAQRVSHNSKLIYSIINSADGEALKRLKEVLSAKVTLAEIELALSELELIKRILQGKTISSVPVELTTEGDFEWLNVLSSLK